MISRTEVKPYWEFIRFCIDAQQPVPESIEKMDWEKLFLFMKQQALTGVGFQGIERLKENHVDVPRTLLLKWYALSEKIKARNMYMDKCCVELAGLLAKDGFKSCVLKGQGNTLFYPDPYVRSSGDIDIFVMSDERMGIKERRKTVLRYVRKRFPQTRVRYQHIDFPVFKDVEVEMHFIPTAKNNPVYNYRIQQWVEKQMPRQCANVVCLPDGIGTIPVPTDEFNLVYQMSHMMHHFLDEGIGLGQMMDYYYLLRKANDELIMDNGPLRMTLRYLNLYQFAGAVMYVMREVFGLEEKMMIVPVDERRGKTLMDEILKGGNFGKHSGLTRHSTGVKYFLKIRRNMRFVREYPAEALCEPWFRTWHFFWRLWNK